jgi:uncharacterized protein (TIGR03437 family)
VAVDASGNLFIANGNSSIQKVNAAGIITTVAGGAYGFSGDGGPATKAALNFPAGVTVDSAGNIYFTDAGNQRVRKVNTAGIISTVAGNGTQGLSGDGGPATSAQFRFDLSSNAGLAVDGAGNLYIADVGNDRVRKVNPAGIISTFAGPGRLGVLGVGDGGPATDAILESPRGVALDSVGNLYIAEAVHDLIRKVTGGSAGGSGGATSGSPAISANGVVNGASLQPGFAANSWVTIFGSNLASTTDNWNSSIVNGKLPTVLDGVSVTISGKPAYVYFISPGQINALAPDVALGPVSVTVTTAAGSSATFSTTAGPYGPGFFLWPGNQPVATRQDFSFAAKAGTFSGATTTPAKPGEVIILWVTGLGPTIPAAPAGVATPSDKTYSTASVPTVLINFTPVTVFGAALAPGAAGLYQIAIQVPATLADGDWPIQASIGGAQSPAGTALSVRR